MSKKLTRSYDDRWLAGVLSGFAKYFNTKPLYLRIAYILYYCNYRDCSRGYCLHCFIGNYPARSSTSRNCRSL